MFERGKKDAGKGGDDAFASQNPPSGWESSSSGSGSQARSSDRLDVAVIGRSIRINGDLQGDEDLRIEGDVTGTVELKNNTLTVGAEGKIRADVYAKAVTVDGLVEGDLYGSERVNIRKNAQVRGNITAPRVSLEDGARFKGSIEMDSESVDKALGTGRGSSGADTGATIKPVSTSSASVSAAGGSSAKSTSASGK